MEHKKINNFIVDNEKTLLELGGINNFTFKNINIIFFYHYKKISW